MWIGDFQRPGQSRDRSDRADTHQPLDALLPGRFAKAVSSTNCFCVDSNISMEPRLMRRRSLTDSGTSSQALHQIGEVFLPVQLLLVERSAAFHQQTRHLVLHAHRLPYHQVAITQQPSQIAQLRG